jgi:hypothetical protein
MNRKYKVDIMEELSLIKQASFIITGTGCSNDKPALAPGEW